MLELFDILLHTFVALHGCYLRAQDTYVQFVVAGERRVRRRRRVCQHDQESEVGGLSSSGHAVLGSRSLRSCGLFCYVSFFQ